MNKKFLFGMFAAIAMLFATSCQNDELDAILSGKESVVSFTLEQPVIATRAYSDGLTAKTLTYAVYEAGTQTLVTKSENEVVFSNKTATVNLRLVTGKSYDILFWADAENAPYTFSAENKAITVNYENIKSQEESRDAFFAVEKALLVDGAITKSIELHRPFAQLNIGTTDDGEDAVKNYNPTHSSVTVKNVYNTLNLFDGKVSNGTEVTYAMAKIPDENVDGNFPVDDVKYLSMNYLLVANEKELVDIEFTVSNGSHNITREYASVPVQRNYRTNIYGKILTDPADFNITITPDYETPDYEVVVWDGKTVTKPAETATEWTVATAAEWAYLIQHGASNKNIKLSANIDFGGHSIKAITNWASMDGQGFAISNFTMLPNSSGYTTGLFQGDGHTANATIKDVTIENVKAVNTTKEYGWIGVIGGNIENTSVVNLEKVNVKNADLCGVKNVAGLIGYVASGATLNIKDCSVDGCYFHNFPVAGESGYVAGLVGRPVGNVTVTSSTVTNTTIDAYYGAPDRKAETIQPMVGTKPELTGGEGVKVIRKSLENAVYPANAEELQTATIGDGAVVVLPEGTFVIPNSVVGKTATFVGSGNNTTIDIPKGQGLSGSTLNFEKVKVAVAANASYTGFQHIAGATYKDCTIEGQVFLYGSSTFENCTFNNSGDNYNVWTYGANKTAFTDCIFNCDGKAVLIYTEGKINAEHTFNNCTFNDSEDDVYGSDGNIKEIKKAAIEIGSSPNSTETTYKVVANSCEVNGFAVTDEGISTNSKLWGNKNSMDKDHLEIVIDGIEVY